MPGIGPFAQNYSANLVIPATSGATNAVQAAANSQKVWVDQYHRDSSFYDAARIDSFTSWIGGENGILYALSDNGRTRRIKVPGLHENILKIMLWNNMVYVACDQGTIAKYALDTQAWTVRRLGKPYRRMAFYDIEILPHSDQLILVGGHQKIAEGKWAIPQGMVLKLPLSLEGVPELAWSKNGQFVWSIRRSTDSDELVMATYDGFGSRIWKSADGGNAFVKAQKVNGLVHHLLIHDAQIWYSGARNYRYKKDGIVGRVGGPSLRVRGAGCVWSLIPSVEHGFLMLTQNGGILSWNGGRGEQPVKLRQVDTPIYEGVVIGYRKWAMVGHGRKLMLFSEFDLPTDEPLMK